jgi:LAGLIDADG endonuclease
LKNIITFIFFNKKNCTYYNEYEYNQLSKINIRSNNLLRVGISETIRTQEKIIKYFPNKTNSSITELNKIKVGTVLKRSISTLSKIEFFQLSALYEEAHMEKKNEIIKDNHNNEISLKFKEWFAGITDGDGYIYVTKEGYVGFEMTLPSHDEKVLRLIQNKFGGNIKAKAGIKAVRYRSQNKTTVIKIINCLNGLINNNIRLAQLHKACLVLNIPIKESVKPTIDSAYISGLLDSDGTLNIYKQSYKDTFRYQLTISIANKSRSNIEILLDVIGGNIYFDRSENGCYF